MKYDSIWSCLLSSLMSLFASDILPELDLTDTFFVHFVKALHFVTLGIILMNCVWMFNIFRCIFLWKLSNAIFYPTINPDCWRKKFLNWLYCIVDVIISCLGISYNNWYYYNIMFVSMLINWSWTQNVVFKTNCKHECKFHTIRHAFRYHIFRFDNQKEGPRIVRLRSSYIARQYKNHFTTWI